jgi:hypothetical protein
LLAIFKCKVHRNDSIPIFIYHLISSFFLDLAKMFFKINNKKVIQCTYQVAESVDVKLLHPVGQVRPLSQSETELKTQINKLVPNKKDSTSML